MPKESDAGRGESGGAGDVAVRALWLLRENADAEQRRIRLSRQEAAFLGLSETWFRRAVAKSNCGLSLADFAGGVDGLLRRQDTALPMEPSFLGRPAKTAGEFNAQVKALRRALRAVLEEAAPAHSMKPFDKLRAMSKVEWAARAPAARKRPQPPVKAFACERRALGSFRWALDGMANRNPTMDDVYWSLADRKCPLYNTPRWKWPGRGHRHKLPDLETWKRYVRKARRAESLNP